MARDFGIRPLPLGRILSEAFALPGQTRERLWRGIGVPCALVIGAALVMSVSGLQGHPRARLALAALGFCCIAAMTVVIHRLVLLPPAYSAANAAGLGLRRLGKAMVAMLILWLIYAVVGVVVAYALFETLVAMGTPLPPPWLEAIGAAAAVWLVARLYMVVPGLVLDQPHALATAWRISRGNGWRLAALLAVIPWLLVLYVQLMWPRGVDRLIFVLVVAMSMLLTIFVLFVASVSYRELMSRVPPPKPPPA
jgi:hypothetical protein